MLVFVAEAAENQIAQLLFADVPVERPRPGLDGDQDLAPALARIIIRDPQPVEFDVFPWQEQVLGSEPVVFGEVAIGIISTKLRATSMQDRALVAQEIASCEGGRLRLGRVRADHHGGESSSHRCRCGTAQYSPAGDWVGYAKHRAFSLNTPWAVQDLCAT